MLPKSKRWTSLEILGLRGRWKTKAEGEGSGGERRLRRVKEGCSAGGDKKGEVEIGDETKRTISWFLDLVLKGVREEEKKRRAD